MPNNVASLLMFMAAWSLDKVVRIVEQHRNKLVVISEQGQLNLILPPNSERACVGDWILLDETNKFIRVLDRMSIFQRKAAGSKVTTQLIATNIDSLMIVCSLNDDLNLNRKEWYFDGYTSYAKASVN